MKNALAEKLTVLCMGLLVLGFVSCSKSDDHPPKAAGLMAFNLAVDQPLIGVALSGNPLPTPLPYTNYTGGYVSIYPGSRSVSTFDAQTNNLIQVDSGSFTSGKYYSMFLIGAHGNYQNLLTADDLNSLQGAQGISYIRYINAIADSSVPTLKMATADSALIDTLAAYGTVSSFRQVPAAEITISLAFGNQLMHTRTIGVEEQKVYTVLLLGSPTATPGGADSLQIRYVENGKLTLDTAAVNAEKAD